MRFDSLAGWLDWQSRLHPRDIELGLDRVQEVWSALGAPRPAGRVLTVAGTNGKGSSVAFADAMLRAGGYRCGCYTSPHLQHYSERIRIDGAAVDDAALCAAFERVDRARQDVPLTYFEFGTLAALLMFAEARLDAVVLEVGLGGRLDAVNVIDPDAALITAIGLDHQAWLGEDREAIGREKAGILRPGIHAVFSAPDMPASIGQRAGELGTRLLVAGRDYRVTPGADAWSLQGAGITRRALPLPAMRGRRQIDNAAGVLVALQGLADRLPLDQQAVRAGLLDARLPGRFDVRPGSPTWVLDVAHNPQAAANLSEMLGDLFSRGRRIAVLGMLDDKDVRGVAAALRQRFDVWHLADLSAQPRGLSAEALARDLAPVVADCPVHRHPDVAAALSAVAAAAADDDLVVVFGSFLTVGAAMDWLDAQSGANTR